MAYNANVRDHMEAFTSAGDLSDEQYLFVSRGANDTVTVTGAGLGAVGVLWTTASAAGRAVSVVTGGEPNVYVGTGGLTVGDAVASDASGAAVTADTADIVLGIARETVAVGGLARIDLLAEAQYVEPA